MDGIPNTAAAELQQAIVEATSAALGRLFSDDLLSRFRLWLKGCETLVVPSKSQWAAREAIDIAATRVGPMPSPLPDYPLVDLLRHPLFRGAAALDDDLHRAILSPREHLANLCSTHDSDVLKHRITVWRGGVRQAATEEERRWWSSSALRDAQKALPAPVHPSLSWSDILGTEAPTALEVLAHERNTYNGAHAERQRAELGDFFASVEKSPLTDEQIDSVVCFDDHELVVAAAGSGKTSTMVAKAGYALKTGYCNPEHILMLAFNSDAAKEVGGRVRERLKHVSRAEKIVAKTFHSFGLEVIGEALGRKPRIAPWLEHEGDDRREMARIVDSLCEHDKHFEAEWNFFRLVYAKDVGRWDEPEDPEDYDKGTRVRGFRTAQGEVVRSKEERTIADWLFYNSVNYVYEPSYEHDVADSRYGQYTPDFYFPEIGLYLEHFALDAEGKAPPHFEPGYEASADWKRSTHAKYGTALIETTSHSLRSGTALEYLREELTNRGVELEFNAGRPAPETPILESSALAKSFRAFQQHVKANRRSYDDLQRALARRSGHAFQSRLRIYLNLYKRISDEWEARLKAGRYVDYDDMLNQAVDVMEQGKYASPYRVVLADEFQDSSTARARLLKGLLASTNERTHLCAVGDDWQAINRFAGADISIMTNFKDWFPEPELRMLTKTFRCPKDLCEASSAFVSKNPAQINKPVVTSNPRTDSSMFLFVAPNRDDLELLVEEQLHTLAARLEASPPAKKPLVMLLHRYRRRGKPERLSQWTAKFASTFDLKFETVHKSKGLEADYVFLMGLTEAVLGFPCKIEDDPALELAMPAGEPFAFAEERRLFYVAMTRAKQELWLFSTANNPSQFVTQLRKLTKLELPNGEPVSNELICPSCERGVLNVRSGPKTHFWGCSRFPACDHRVWIKRNEVVRKCPQCETGQLLSKRRKADGVPFLGCSNYPDCRCSTDI